jgi:integrase
MTTLQTLQSDLGVDPFAAIDRANLADSTRRQYKRQLELYLEAGHSLGDANQLLAYSQTLKGSPRSFLKAAVRLWAKEVERQVKASATPETAAAATATLYRLDALNDSIQVEQHKGQRPHTWLSGSQIKHLKEVIADERDYLIISLMLQAGLRRNEVVTLEAGDVQMMGDRWVLAVCGKGSKNRTIPVTNRLARRLRAWNGEGVIFPLSGQAVMDICRKYGRMIEVPALAPHDLRRTFAQTALDNGVTLDKIARLLGHASVNTTVRYLDLDTQKLPVVGAFLGF